MYIQTVYSDNLLAMVISMYDRYPLYIYIYIYIYIYDFT